MKILYYTFVKDIDQDSGPVIKHLEQLGHDVLIYQPHNNRETEYRIQTRHFQMYEDLLDRAVEHNVDLIYHHDFLSSPEYLLAELKARPNFHPKISFTFQFREANRSKARALVLKELLDSRNIHKAVAVCLMVKNLVYPKNIRDTFSRYNFLKLAIAGETYVEHDSTFTMSKADARKKFGFDEKDFIALWTGRLLYTKGADIFVESLKHVRDDIKIVIQKSIFSDDMGGSILEEAKKNHENTLVLDQMFPLGTIGPLFIASDLAICAHRRYYEYGSVGVPPNTASAKIPFVAPDFYFFNEMVKEYKMGTLFTPENPISLAQAINYTKNYYQDIMREANFKGFLENVYEKSTWAEMAVKGL